MQSHPMLCTCGVRLAHVWKEFSQLRPERRDQIMNADGRKVSEILEALGITNDCCRTRLTMANVQTDVFNRLPREGGGNVRW